MPVCCITQIIYLLSVIVFFSDKCYSIRVALRAPRYVMVNGTATLKCEYDVNENQVYKVEWLRGGNKIYQFIKGRNPPFNNFTVIGADIDWTESDEKRVSLKNLQFEASGVYICEVTTDNPIYTKPSEEEYLVVMQTQSENPRISFNEADYKVGDILDANCTSSPATPVPELTWLLNGKKVPLTANFIGAILEADESLIRSYPESMKSSSMVQLTMAITMKQAPQLILTCLSTIPGYMGHVNGTEYADYRDATIQISIAVPPTEAAQTASACITRLALKYFLISTFFVCAKWIL